MTICALSAPIDFLLFGEEAALRILPFTIITTIECDALLRMKVLPPLRVWLAGGLYSWAKAS